MAQAQRRTVRRKSSAGGISHLKSARNSSKRSVSSSIPDMVQAQHRSDPWILSAVFLLLCVGLLMVYSTTAVLSQENFGSPTLMIKKHLLHMGIGLIAMGICSRVPASLLYKLAVPALLSSTFLLLLVLIPGIGASAGGAQRWIVLGPLRMQPGELAKLSMIIFIASYVSRKSDRFGSIKTSILVPFFLFGIVAVLLLAQPDFGSTAVIAIIISCQILLSARISHFASLAVAGMSLGAMLIWTSPYRMKRLITFLDPFENPDSSGYQLIQSLIAVGSAGVSGAGLGAGKQKLFYLPAAHTDFIFAVVAEEMGFAGCVFVLGLFMVIFWRGLDLANALRETPFLSNLALGLVLLVVLPALLNMGVVLGLLPTKGLVLPLIAYGGTAMVVQLAIVGLLLSISRLRP